jgi:nucleoid DNA-binding protein
MNKKCTKDDLSRIVGNELLTSHKEGKRILDTVLDSIIDLLSEENNIYLRNFGTFHIRENGERSGRNPKTGETFTVPAKKKVLFKSGKRMKSGVNND